MKTKHWYVYKQGGGIPWYRHTSEDTAVLEAKRLCELHGGVYEILEAKALVKESPKFIVEPLLDARQIQGEQTDDDIPF